MTNLKGRYCEGFNAGNRSAAHWRGKPNHHLASDTQAISDYLRSVIIKHYNLNETNTGDRFADTRDTLCYATNDNQSAVYGLLQNRLTLPLWWADTTAATHRTW